MVDAKTAECNTKKTKYEDKKSECGSLQDQMDSASCLTLSTSEAVCASYRTCYQQHSDVYQAVVAATMLQESGIKSEWEALLNMQCLLTIFEKSGADKTSAVETCNAQDHATPASLELSLMYPTPVPQVAQNCTVIDDHAGTDAYDQEHFSGLPSNTEPKTCTAVCCKKCAEFTCPETYMLKTDSAIRFGSSRHECCYQPFPGTSVLTRDEMITQLKNWGASTNEGFWQQCYKKTVDGDSATIFHEKCDHAIRSMTVMRLSNGKVIGGHAGGSWSGYGSHGTSLNYLFSLTNNYRHSAHSGTTSGILKSPTAGPSWGVWPPESADLYVDSSMNGGLCYIGKTYNCRVGSNTGVDSSCRTDFCGTTFNFQILELEVYAAASY